MNEIHFRTLDLNLFRVLMALLERRSVSGAAAELALTPSAVSHALGRLRIALGDPLFERRGGVLTPTAYALDVGRRAGPALDQLRDATERMDFDPRRSERQFVLSGGAPSAAVLLPPLLRRLREAAPRVRIRFLPVQSDFLEAVEHGRVDIAFSVAPSSSKRVSWRRLFEDDLIWTARKDHPFVRAPLTVAMLRRAQHVVMERFRPIFGEEYAEARHFLDEASELRTAYSEALETDDATARAAIIVSDLTHALLIVRSTDAVTLTMRRFAQALAPEALQILAPPHPTPPLEIGAIYASTHDPGVEWLLEQLSQAMAVGD
ncbi:MAG TPA: LysR family transcriptional regulator [Caulobacterales bacterium]|nr:LysR family transcriptional regulator [Caulobacterales bacterium]